RNGQSFDFAPCLSLIGSQTSQKPAPLPGAMEQAQSYLRSRGQRRRGHEGLCPRHLAVSVFLVIPCSHGFAHPLSWLCPWSGLVAATAFGHDRGPLLGGSAIFSGTSRTCCSSGAERAGMLELHRGRDHLGMPKPVSRRMLYSAVSRPGGHLSAAHCAGRHVSS